MRHRVLEHLCVAFSFLIIVMGPSGVQAQRSGAESSGGPGQAQKLPQLVERAIPADPNDPIATVNGVAITRAQLANECVARHGTDVLESLIMRSLLDQAIQQANITVTAAEIDAEILRHAQPYGLDKQQFLQALARERNLSPRQYAQQIAFPAVALRKLSIPRVKVTEEDLDDAFEAYFGPKLHVRAIMVESQKKAIDIWNQLRENPGIFASLAREISIDQQSAAMGGLMDQPIVRHAEPINVSNQAFEQLVDGEALLENEPESLRKAHMPKDGDITGPIMVSDDVWAIFQRERLEEGQKVDRSNPEIINNLKARIFDAKVQNEMQVVMQDLFVQAAIDNHLTGKLKYANEEQSQVRVSDEEVRRTRMSRPDDQIPTSDATKTLKMLNEVASPEEINMERPVGAPKTPKPVSTKTPDPK